MKQIIGELHGMQYYAWPFTAYMLGSTIIIPICGEISDAYGDKPVFLAGIFVFLFGSVFCGCSRNLLWLVVARSVQGLGGGCIVSSVFTTVALLFPPQQRGKYTGLVTSGVASIIGPVVGGLVTDYLGWRWIFFLNLPLGIVAAVFIAVNLPDCKEDKSKDIDGNGIVLLVVSLLPFLLAFSLVETCFPWNSWFFKGLLIFAALGFVLFGWHETKTADPVISLSCLSDRAVSMSLVMAFLNQALMFAVILFLPYFVQVVMGSSATVSGIAITPMMIGLLLASNLSGQLISRIGKCKLLSIGAFLLSAGGMFLLSTLGANATYGTVVLYAVLTGFAIGINMPISNVNAQNAVPRERIGSITSSVMFCKNLGRTVGSAVYGAILANAMRVGLARLDMDHLPATLQAFVHNPTGLVNVRAVEKLQAYLPQDVLQQFNALLQQADHVLLAAVKDVFLAGMLTAIVGAFLMIFLKEALFEKKQ
jgi:EmrB/QacA subfamily drug resistance transporter